LTRLLLQNSSTKTWRYHRSNRQIFFPCISSEFLAHAARRRENQTVQKCPNTDINDKGRKPIGSLINGLF
jgi:hypothetical protein